MNKAAVDFPVSQYDAAALETAHLFPDTWLTEAEKRRAADLGAAGSRFVAGRLLARHRAGTMLQLAPEELRVESSCSKCGSDLHGTPELVGPREKGEESRWAISLSRSDTHVLVGLVLRPRTQLEGDVSIGVDLTSTNAKGESMLRGLDASFFTEEDLWAVPTRAQWWAMKEALGKARGTGIVPAVPNILEAGGFTAAEINRAHESPAMPSVPAHVSCGVVIYEPANGSKPELRQLFLK